MNKNNNCYYYFLIIIRTLDFSLPVVHYLADVVFFIYLYQRWIYRIDLKRVNEFGYTGEDLTGASASTEQAAEPQPDESQQKSDKKND